MSDKSRLVNCEIHARDDGHGPLFTLTPQDTVECNLDGYVILPKERYHAMVEDLTDFYVKQAQGR